LGFAFLKIAIPLLLGKHRQYNPHITPMDRPVAKPGINMEQCTIEMYASYTMTDPHDLWET